MGMNSKTVLTSAGILMVVGIVVVNAMQAPPPDIEAKEQASDAQDVEAKPLTMAEKEEMRKSIKEGIAKSQPATGKSVEGVPEIPIIVLPRVENYAPQPNDSSIATHWYREDSRSAKRAEELEKERG
ncbi:MAG: hypothetical protein AB7F50_08425 [Fimbriimonadaceae bacterium]